MGNQSFFCCFNGKQPMMPCATGIGASVFCLAFLIWGLADVGFKRDGVKAIYIIAFIFVILVLLIFIFALILFLITLNPSSYRSVNNIGRILCLAAIIMCGIALVFLFVSFIVLLVDYVKLKNAIDDAKEGKEVDYEGSWAIGEVIHYDQTELKIKGSEWAAVIVPLLFSFICLPIMALAANYLYKLFSDKMNTPPPTIPVYANTQNALNIPNDQQPGLFPNNTGSVPPMGNNIAYPVPVQQTGPNNNQ